MKSLLAKLQEYNSTVVPPIYTFGGGDPRSDPSKHGGAWTPWLEQ